jgi:acyl dehydratase
MPLNGASSRTALSRGVHARRHEEIAYEHPEWETDSTGSADEAVNIGDRISFTKTVTGQDARTFAAASGDANRLHLDEEFAEASGSVGGSFTERS